MKLRRHCLGMMVIFVLTSTTRADNHQSSPADKLPAFFNKITTVPANHENLAVHFSVNQDGDGEGEELPASIWYVKKNSTDYFTSMTVTDFSMCTRPLEKKICQSFMQMITDVPPALGTEVTETRIGGAGYVTVFLTQFASVQFDAVDRFIAFIGADSQDPPFSHIVLYIYAQKGTNLIQLSALVDECTAPLAPNQSDISYYRQFCVTETILKKAQSTGEMLTELFRLRPISVVAPTDEDGWNEYTIRSEDFEHPGAPQFEQYHIPLQFKGKSAPINLQSHPDAKRWQSELKEANQTGPNFADYLTVVTWGCGSGCRSIALIDTRNGQVYFPDNLRTNIAVNIHDEVENTLVYHRDSNLFIVAGCPNGECATRRGITYFIWTGNGFEEIFRVPKGWYPEN